LIHELTERGVGVRNLADPVKVNSADPADVVGQLVVLLALFAQMERTYTTERAAACWTQPCWRTRCTCVRRPPDGSDRG